MLGGALFCCPANLCRRAASFSLDCGRGHFSLTSLQTARSTVLKSEGVARRGIESWKTLFCSAPMRWKPVEAAQDKSWPPVRLRGIVETEAWQPADQSGDGNFSFNAGKLRSKAKMDAAAKRHWPDAFARDIKLVRIQVDGWVAIGRPEQAQDRFPLANLDAAHGHVLQGCARRDLNRRVVSKQLFDGIRSKRGVLLQRLKLVRIAMKREQAV